MADLTNDELAAIEARCAAATPGPWHAHKHAKSAVIAFPDRWSILRIGYPSGPEVAGSSNGADADLIAAARTDIPRLVAALRAEREQRERLEKALDAARAMAAAVERTNGLPRGSTPDECREIANDIMAATIDFGAALAALDSQGGPR